MIHQELHFLEKYIMNYRLSIIDYLKPTNIKKNKKKDDDVIF